MDAGGSSGAGKRPGNDDASYVAAMNLRHGRKRFKLTCPRPPPVEESADQAMGTPGAKDGQTLKPSPTNIIETDAEKKTSKHDSGEKDVSVKQTWNVTDDGGGDEVQILCQVFNGRHNNKYVRLEGNKEVEHTLEKDIDVLEFVTQKQKEVRSSSFLAVQDHQSDDLASDAETNVGTSETRDIESRGEELLGAVGYAKTGGNGSRGEDMMGAADDERRGEDPAVSVEDKGTCDERRLRKRNRVNIVNPLTPLDEEFISLFEGDDDDDDYTKGETKKNTRTNPRHTDGESQKNQRTRAEDTDGESKKNTRTSRTSSNGEIQKNPVTSSRKIDGESQKDPMTSGKKTVKSAKLNATNVCRIIANSLLDTEDGHTEELLNITKELAPPIDKSKYKFRFPTDIPELPVEKSAHEVENDNLFDLLNMSLTSEQIGSTDLEDNSGAQTGNDGAPITAETLCSQGKHYLIEKDPIGIVCKYCSHVDLESRYMLPKFYEPRSRRPLTTASKQAKRAGIPSYLLDEIAGTDRIKNHGTEDYKELETVWDLIPGTRRNLYEHQREGFEFIWKNLVGDTIIEKLEKPLSSSGHGCIISHAPGTGKTRLTIVFLQSFMKMYPDARPVIVAPKSLLLTWEEEFRKWNLEVPFHNLNKPELTGHEDTAAASLWKKGKGSSKNNETDVRVLKLYTWKMKSSILGLTYQLFEHIVGAEARDPKCNPSVQQMGKALLKLPTVLVLDEGHTPRNNDSNIYRFLHNVDTKRRIILSGTPFQNNFDELYNTLCLVNPEFEKTTPKDSNVAKTKNKKIGRDLQSKWSSLTNFGGHDGEKLRELKALIGPFVHVHKGTILQENCPGLTDSMVLLQPTELQRELIALVKEKARTNPFHYERVMSLLSVHPSLLPKEWLDHEDFSAYRDRIERLKTDPYGGTKTKFVIELCRMSQALNEKVVIFCQYLDPLDIIRDQLQAYFGWIQGREVLYISGSLDPKQRQSCINAVNDPKSNARVLLASIRACSEGIHLVGVSRVVLLDVVWNPSVERQAISRAYRIGQQKMVYTYHLIDKTTEVDKYSKQLEKDKLSELVFSFNDQLDDGKRQMPEVVFEDGFLQEMFQRNDKLGNMIERICYNPKASNLAESFNAVAE